MHVSFLMLHMCYGFQNFHQSGSSTLKRANLCIFSLKYNFTMWMGPFSVSATTTSCDYVTQYFYSLGLRLHCFLIASSTLFAFVRIRTAKLSKISKPFHKNGFFLAHFSSVCFFLPNPDEMIAS